VSNQSHSFDPAGTVSLEKLPGAFWIQALAVRASGFHTWVIILAQTPQQPTAKTAVGSLVA
jgi:4-amino-4-deoxy-L-arabinose transferase-like glycosyltransferase